MADDNKQEPTIKVTDRRMFTADGKLREGFEQFDSDAATPAAKAAEKPSPAAEPPSPAAEPPSPAAEPPSPAAEPPPPAAEPPPPAAEPPAAGPARAEAEARAAAAMAGEVGALGTPSFLELVGILAEPIALYLGDAKLPDGSSAENLDAARFYIDLLDVLRSKTAGNLTPREESVLEDVLYQLRMRYVRKRG